MTLLAHRPRQAVPGASALAGTEVPAGAGAPVAEAPVDAEALIEEALIEEARRLRWRRWLAGTSAVVVAATIVSGIYVAIVGGPTGSTRPRVATTTSANGPYVDAQALGHEGELAFISRDRLWVLDGARRTVRALPLPRGFVPAAPSFSHDGRWLAYVGTHSTPSQGIVRTGLWIARADGTGAHEVTVPDAGRSASGGLAIGELVGWSPTEDLLAVTANTTVRYPSGVSGQQATRLELVAPDGTARELVALRPTTANPVRIENAVWSPDGRDVAVSVTAPAIGGGTTIAAYPVDGVRPTTWFSISGSAKLPGICTGCGGNQTIADLAGWWKGWGIGFWVFNSGMVHNNDDTPVELVTAPAATPRIIGRTLSDGSTVAIASSSTGRLAIVASTGGREYGQGKVVEVCRHATASCAPIPGATTWNGQPLPCPPEECKLVPRPGSAGSGVSVDPSWSPDGALLTYEKAPTVPNDVAPIDQWYGAHELYLWDPATDTSRKVAALQGASVPTWSRDGKDLLYVDGDALWLWPVSGGRPTKVASPLFAPQELASGNSTYNVSYYDQVDWIGQFGWWSPR